MYGGSDELLEILELEKELTKNNIQGAEVLSKFLDMLHEFEIIDINWKPCSQ